MKLPPRTSALRPPRRRKFWFLIPLFALAFLFWTSNLGQPPGRVAEPDAPSDEISAGLDPESPILSCAGSNIPPTPLLVDKLKQKLMEAMKTALKGVKRVAYLGFPLNSDKGDSLSAWGEITLLKELGIEIVVHQIDGAETEAEAVAEEIRAKLGSRGDLESSAVLFHGGGTLGDLEAAQLHFRLYVVERLPGYRVIFLPQAVLFSESGADLLARTKVVFEEAKNVTIMALEDRSVRFVEGHFGSRVTVLKSPAAGFALAPQRVDKALSHRNLPRNVEVLYLLRTDHESNFEEFSTDSEKLKQKHPGQYVEAGDWITYAEPLTLSATEDPDPFVGNKERARLAFEYLARGKIAVVDRLHGHIAALILDIPHVILDNKFGQIADFYGTWTFEADNVVHVEGKTLWNSCKEADRLGKRDFDQERMVRCGSGFAGA